VGWALNEAGLRITKDGGATWSTATPEGLAPDVVDAVTFADLSHGWIVASQVGADGGPRVELLRTTDGGATWSENSLPYAPPAAIGQDGAAIDAVDTTHVWVVLRNPGSAASESGVLFASSDGGSSWATFPIPIADQLEFIDDQTGFATGGVAGDKVFKTADGGKTWEGEALPPIFGGEQIRVGVPTFVGSDEAILPVTIVADQSVEVFLTTSDAGGTWTGAGTVNLGISTDHASVMIQSAGAWLAVGDAIYRTADAGQHWDRASLELPVGAVLTDVQFADAEHAWALDPLAVCLGQKANCQTRIALLQTDDSGGSWTELRP
jgi:photosystem II stability/assembly factor-like uncharacterized protein